ncbi:MAG: ABC transporter substrate-binding protein [Rhizobiaceae bacterium]|nr:ABC transporter substrate-binding protein [Rhizobiaceae bacterium]
MELIQHQKGFKVSRKLSVSATISLSLLTATAAVANEITITSWGGTYQDGQRVTYFEPFTAKTGTKVVEETYSGELAKIKAQVDSGDVTWDVVDVDSNMIATGCDEGLFETLDYSRILDRSKFIDGAATDCAVGTIVVTTVTAYDKTVFAEGPKTVNDFFDLQKFPGKRGLWKRPYVNLEWALIADGVAIGDVYKQLSTPEGVDRAFAKLDTIKDQLVWWEAGAQPAQLLADKEVAITSAWSGRIQTAISKENKPFAVVWDAQALDFNFWAIPRGAKKLDDSYAFIAFASDASVMSKQSLVSAYGPTNKDALALIAPDVVETLPTAESHMTNPLVYDAKFWGQNGEELTKRFNNWLAK